MHCILRPPCTTNYFQNVWQCPSPLLKTFGFFATPPIHNFHQSLEKVCFQNNSQRGFWGLEFKGHSSRKDKYCISANSLLRLSVPKVFKEQKYCFRGLLPKIDGRYESEVEIEKKTSSAVKRSYKRIWMQVHKVFDQIVKRRRRSNKRGLGYLNHMHLFLRSFRHNISS